MLTSNRLAAAAARTPNTNHHPRPRPVEAAPPEKAPARRGFTFTEVTRVSAPAIEIVLSTLLLSIGTTAWGLLNYVLRRLLAGGYAGGGGGPAAFLGMDSALPEGADPAHFLRVGVDGNGTSSAEGRRSFHAFEDRIERAVFHQVSSLFEAHPRYAPLTPTQRAARIEVVASCGGTSGGMVVPVIELARRVARARGVEDVRMGLTLIGPEILVNAADRRVQPYQRDRIRATYAQNLQAVFESIAAGDGPAHVHSLTLIDRRNEQHCVGTIDEFVALHGEALFFRLFTRASDHFDQRVCDQHGCGEDHGRTS